MAAPHRACSDFLKKLSWLQQEFFFGKPSLTWGFLLTFFVLMSFYLFAGILVPARFMMACLRAAPHMKESA